MSTDNQGFINLVFTAAMRQMSLLGHDESNLIDCTEVIPDAEENNDPTTFPPTLSATDLDADVPQNVSRAVMPKLASHMLNDVHTVRY